MASRVVTLPRRKASERSGPRDRRYGRLRRMSSSAGRPDAPSAAGPVAASGWASFVATGTRNGTGGRSRRGRGGEVELLVGGQRVEANRPAPAPEHRQRGPERPAPRGNAQVGVVEVDVEIGGQGAEGGPGGHAEGVRRGQLEQRDAVEAQADRPRRREPRGAGREVARPEGGGGAVGVPVLGEH